MLNSDHNYKCMVVPKRGDWVVLSSPRHWAQSDFGAGRVDHVAGYKVFFVGTPLGGEVHKLDRIWGVYPNEEAARRAAHLIREAQSRHAQETALAQLSFANAVAAAGAQKSILSNNS